MSAKRTYAEVVSGIENTPITAKDPEGTLEKLKPLFRCNKKPYVSKEVKENALSSKGKSCRPETKTIVNRYVCHDLSV